MTNPVETQRNRHLIEAYPALIPVCDSQGRIMAFTFAGGWRADWLTERFQRHSEHPDRAREADDETGRPPVPESASPLLGQGDQTHESNRGESEATRR